MKEKKLPTKTTQAKIYPELFGKIIDKMGKDMLQDMECMAICSDGVKKAFWHYPKCPYYEISINKIDYLEPEQ